MTWQIQITFFTILFKVNFRGYLAEYPMTKMCLDSYNQSQDGCNICGFFTRNCVTRGDKKFALSETQFTGMSHLSNFTDYPAWCFYLDKIQTIGGSQIPEWSTLRPLTRTRTGIPPCHTPLTPLFSDITRHGQDMPWASGSHVGGLYVTTCKKEIFSASTYYKY